MHTPGQGNLLRLVDGAGLTNVRVADGDATVLLRESLPSASLAAVRVFFRDPWPKARHVKRRLVDAGLRGPWSPTASPTTASCTSPRTYPRTPSRWLPSSTAEPRLTTTDPPWRPTTRFERRGAEAGRPATDLAARRVSR